VKYNKDINEQQRDQLEHYKAKQSTKGSNNRFISIYMKIKI